MHVFPMSFQGHSWRLKALEFQYSRNLASDISVSWTKREIFYDFHYFIRKSHYKYITSTDPNINSSYYVHIWSAVSTIHLLALEPRGKLRFLQTIFHSKTIIFRLRVVIAPCMWIEIHKITHIFCLGLVPGG